MTPALGALPPPPPPPLAPLPPAPPPPLAPADDHATLLDLPDALQEAVAQRLGLADLAALACTCRALCDLSLRALARKQVLSEDVDLPRLPRQLNFLLLGSEGGEAAQQTAADRLRLRVLGYVPEALHHASLRCHALQRLHLELPPPQLPLSAAAEAVARAAAGEPWVGPAALVGLVAAADVGCPPVDGFLLKLVAQCCPDLRSLRLVNVTNNATLNRLVRLNDYCLAVVARSCPLLDELVIGHRGGEECLFNPHAPFFLEDVTDGGLRAVAQHCTRLRRLGLLRCSRVGDAGLLAVAQLCTQLTALLLHDCPGVSERGLVSVGEKCGQLRALHCTAARRAGGLLLGAGDEGEQLGFRALFTIAANCPLLEDLWVSEEGLEAPVVDDDCMVVLAQGCPRLRCLALRHCGAVTDGGLHALAARCTLLEELALVHTAAGDAGVAALAQRLPHLRRLSISNYVSSLGLLPGGARAIRGISDGALAAVARHCRGLSHLSITGSRRVSDAGLLCLAGLGGTLPAPPFLSELTSLTINHTAATDGAACQLLQRCPELRSLSLRGLLFNVDGVGACLASHCTQLTALDLRHCSTLSDAGLAEIGRLPFLRCLYLSFCVRLTNAGLWHLVCGARRTSGDDSGGGGDDSSMNEAAGCTPSASLLRSLELYHCPQVTNRGLQAVVAACPDLQCLNIGKCRLVRPEGLRRLAAAHSGLRLSAAHYLDG